MPNYTVTSDSGEHQIFRALGDPSRWQLFRQLCDCAEPQTVSQISRRHPADLDLSVVSRHLSKLKQQDLVHSKRHGQSVHYSANAAALADALRRVADALETCACCSAPDSSSKKKPDKGDQ